MPHIKNNKTKETVVTEMHRSPSSSEQWPVRLQHAQIKWYPASSRLIGLVRTHTDKFVLPPAVVRKASWRD